MTRWSKESAFPAQPLGTHGEPVDALDPGLTKLEYAAIMAMNGLLQNYASDREDAIADNAKVSVMYAKALFAELEKETA